ncbi:MAG: DUF1294 domain-containing protein [Firmicutes bacterium]|nr:DUF1294 domain-containing protein [Bacillota bacterium]
MILKIYAAVLVVVSLIAFILYGVDKSRAVRKAWRIKESVLLGLGLLGGAAGALLGMKVFHHKTKHWYFWAVNACGLVVQIAVLGLIIHKL